jgi:RHS repeat-associated protein
MTDRISRRAIACALFASTALTATMFAASPASAQLSSPTSRPAPDPNGVDVITGQPNAPLETVSIGQPGESGLTYLTGFVDGADQDTFVLELTGLPTASSRIVNIQGRTIEFTKDASGVFQPNDANGATLVQTGNDYTYTARDGTVIQFASADGDPSGFGVSARGTTVTKPNGERLSYSYRVQQPSCPQGQICTDQGAVRVQSVTSNLGYQLKAYYAANTYNPDSAADWTRLTQVVAINNAVDFCTPAGDTCPTFTQAWPKLTLNETVAGATVTDTLTDNLSNTVTVTSSTGSLAIRSPGDPANDVSYTFDANNRVATLTRGGGTWSYTYSDSGSQRTTTVTQPLGGTRIYVSDLNLNRVLSITDELGRTTTMQYDSSGRLTRKTQPEGNYTQLTYDARGNVTTTTNVAKPGSGLANIVASAAFPASCSNAKTCNEPTSTTDANGNTTDYTYDANHGGVLTATRPAPSAGAVRPQVRYGYTALSAYYKNSTGTIVAAPSSVYRLTSVSACQTNASCAGTADEVKSTIAYGSAGVANNLLPTSGSKGNGSGTLTATVVSTYDNVGNVLTIDGPLPGSADTSGFQYDADRRLTVSISPDPDGSGPLPMRAERFTYDANGNVTRIEEGTATSLTGAFTPAASGERAEMTYDGLGRKLTDKLVSGTIASPVVNTLTQYSHDAKGRLNCAAVRMNPAAFGSLPADACTLGTAGSFGPDRITKSVYDNADEVTQVQVAVGTADAANERTLTYSNNGALQTLTDGENNKTTYVRDGFDRLSQTQYPSPTKGAGTSNASDFEQLTYDPNGNVTSRRLRDATSIAFTYDNLDRVTFKDLPGTEPDVTYAYDNLSRLTSASQTGNALTFGYDALSRETSEAGPQGTVTSAYDLAGNRTSIAYPGTGLTVNMDYLVTGEVSKIRENGATSGVGVLATYAYDNEGRRTSLTFGNGVVQNFAYDPVSRLATLTNDLAGTTNDLTHSFAYDPASEITSLTRSNDNYAFIKSAVSQTGVANGLNQLTSVGGVTASYDTRGNLTSDPMSGKTYGYSSENLLTSASGGVTLAYDPLLRLYQVAGAATTRFAYDGSNLIADYDGSNNLQHRYVFGPGVDAPIVEYAGSGTTARTFLSTDERGSVIARTDSSGALSSINTYDEYGVPGPSNAGRFQYTGQMWLSEIGLYDYKARMYGPNGEGFLQTDPAGYAAGANLYAYVMNDPVNRRDPTGLTCEDIAEGVASRICLTQDSSASSQTGNGGPPSGDPGAPGGNSGGFVGGPGCPNGCMSPSDPLAPESLAQNEGYYLGNVWVSTAGPGNEGFFGFSFGAFSASSGEGTGGVVVSGQRFRPLNPKEIHFYSHFYGTNLLSNVIIFNGLPPWMSESEYNGLTVSSEFIYISSNLYSQDMLSSSFAAGVLGHELYHALVQYANGATIWDFIAASAQCGCTGSGSAMERPAYIMQSNIQQMYDHGVR